MGMGWQNDDQQARIVGKKAALTAALATPPLTWFARITDEYEFPIDPRYRSGETYSWVTAEWRDHVSLELTTREKAADHSVFSVLWPEPDKYRMAKIPATLDADNRLTVKRPDGKTDVITLTDDKFIIE